MHMEGEGVVGGFRGAPLLAVGILVVGARVEPFAADNEGKPTEPLLSAMHLFDRACDSSIGAGNAQA